MTNKFSQIEGHRRVAAETLNKTSNMDSQVKGKPQQQRIGRTAYDTLMGLLALDSESPTTPYGVLIANSTKRNLKVQIEELFIP